MASFGLRAFSFCVLSDVTVTLASAVRICRDVCGYHVPHRPALSCPLRASDRHVSYVFVFLFRPWGSLFSVLLFFQGHTHGTWRFSGLGAKSELQLPAYSTAQQRWILNPLNETRDRTGVPMDTSRVPNSLSHKGSSCNLLSLLDGQIRFLRNICVVTWF